jgi:MFS family permease
VTRRALLVAAVAVAVAVAFADSSIVVLALPELYARFDTTIEGVAWVITSYNLVLAICALALVLVVHHARANLLLAAGTVLFLAASIACALADSIGFLIAARSVQGLGGALLLAGSLPVLGALGGSTARGVAIWTLAGTFGAAVGPALGGVLTQLFDWRAIFVFQAPVAGAALLATFGAHVAAILREGWRPSLWRTVPGNVALALLSGALVGTLFLGVLLVIDVFGLTPIQGAAVVSAIPAATLLARPLGCRAPGRGRDRLGRRVARGRVGRARVPAVERSGIHARVVRAVRLGARAGRAGSHAHGARRRGRDRAEGDAHRRHPASRAGARRSRSGPRCSPATSVAGADVAKLNATAVIIDGEIPATTKIPLALDIRDELERAPKGEIPDFAAAFEEAGAGTDDAVQQVHDDLVETIERAVTRSFRPSFLFCALLAALALVPILVFRRRWEA